MIFDLVKDFAEVLDLMPQEHPRQRIVKLLDEAVRRDVHFINRHPTTLFQCLWNTCWWYDCPEAAKHYCADPPTRNATRSSPGMMDAPSTSLARISGRPECVWQRMSKLATVTSQFVRRMGWRLRERVTGNRWCMVGNDTRAKTGPWNEPGKKLNRLLDRWRALKAEDSPGFRWVRSLRPPGIHLESPLKQILSGHEDQILSLAFSPDGRFLFSSARDHTIRVWDLERGTELHCLRESAIQSRIAISMPSARPLALERLPAAIRVTEKATNQELCQLSTGHQSDRWTLEAVDAIAGKRVTATRDFTVSIADAATAAVLLQFQCYDTIAFVSLSPNGDWLATGSLSGTIRIWDTTSPHHYRPLVGDDTRLKWLTLSPDGNTLVTPSWMYVLRLWDANLALECRRFIREPLPREALLTPGSLGPAAFTPNGGDIAWVNGSVVYVIHTETAQTRRLRPQRTASDMLYTFQSSLTISPDGRRAAAHLSDSTVRVWDFDTGEELRTFCGNRIRKTALSFSPDGGQLVVLWGDMTLRTFDVVSGDVLTSFSCSMTWPLELTHTPDGRRLVITGKQSTQILDAATGECLSESDSGSDVHAIASGPSMYPCQARSRSLETVFVDGESGGVIGFLDEKYDHLISYAHQNKWAASAGNYLSVIALEQS